MGKDDQIPLRLNLGCGLDKRKGWLNADFVPECCPDICFNANEPWPFNDETFYEVYASHVYEHLTNWWGAFKEAARILKPGGRLTIKVPDESASMAGTYRDHVVIISQHSFHGIQEYFSGTNAWAIREQCTVPLGLIHYEKIPFKKYNWMPGFMIRFCADHLRNFIHEQKFVFVKM